jgi:S1-C subfamily serine protease
VIRNDRLFTTSVSIRNLSRTIHDRWGAGPFSGRRFELGRVIIHDTPIGVDECGGPLVNLRGQVVGVNIARALRVASCAIASEDIVSWVRKAEPNAKLRIKSDLN